MSDKSMEYIDVHDILNERERLESDFSLIKRDFEKFKTILTNYENSEEYIYDKSKLEEIAKYILDLTNSKISSNYLMSLLDDIYSYMDIDAFRFFAKCYDVASSVVFEADFDMTPYNCANTILQEIKKQSLSLNEAQKNVAKERFGEKYTQFLSYEFPVSEIGLSLSSAWKELNLKYPQIFKKTILEETQAIELFGICNILKEVAELLDEYCKEEYLRWLSNEIYDKCWTIYNIKRSDEHKNIISKLQNDYKAREVDYILNHKVVFEKTYFYLYNKKLKKIEEIKKLSAERMERYRLEVEAKTRMQKQYVMQCAKDREATNKKTSKQSIRPAMFVLSIIGSLKAKLNMDFYYNSIMYREKCYKKVSNMKEYLDKGIISEEEFEKNKKEILKNIKM